MSSSTMNIRRQKILNELNIHDKIYVNTLARELHVTTETIRRDLDYLDANHQLKKIFGGAVKVKNNRIELIYQQRLNYHLEVKQKIACIAAGLIEDDDTIAIQGGSTTQQLIPYLIKKNNLTLITNSLPISTSLLQYQEAGKFNGRLIFLGGEIHTATMASSGYFAENMLSNLSFNKAIFSCGGFTPSNISTYLAEHIRLSQILIEKSDINILLADSSKMNVNYLYKFADFQNINTIVTDCPMPKQWADSIDTSHLDWIDTENVSI